MISYRATTILALASFGLPAIAPNAPSDAQVYFDGEAVYCPSLLHPLPAFVALSSMTVLLVQGLRNRRANSWISGLGAAAFGYAVYEWQWELSYCLRGSALAGTCAVFLAFGFLYLRHLLPSQN